MIIDTDPGVWLAEQSNSGEATAARAVQVACDADLTSINAMILHRLRALR